MMRNQKGINKVFCIGWHKTGTSTLGTALIKLGYEVVGFRLDAVDALSRGDMNSVLDIAGKYDALSDLPWADLYKELDDAFPGSKFILTIRDENRWLNSAAKHYGDTYFWAHEWFYGEGVLQENEERYLKRYKEHNQQVLSYFSEREDDLLVLNFEEKAGWEELCPFLGCSIPDKKFPHANKGKHNYNRRDRVISSLRTVTPNVVRDAVFTVKLFILKQLGYKDPRDKFNNFHQNRKAKLENSHIKSK